MEINLFSLSRTLLVTALVFCTVVLSSCHKEYDNDEDDDCGLSGNKTDVALTLSVDNSFSLYDEVYISDTTVNTRADGAKILNYHICAYDYSNNSLGKLVSSTTSTNSRINLTLPLGKVRIYAWADYVDEDNPNNIYFHTDDFSDMLLINKFSYQGNDAHKAAFYASADIAVSYRTDPVSLKMKPVMGQYKIIAQDAPDYDIGRVVVYYHKGLPSSYNLFDNNICHLWSGVTYVAEPNDDFLAGDNVISEPSEKNISVKIEVYDTDNHLGARRANIEFPLIQGGCTVVYANVYTILETPEDSNSDNGGGINSEFNDTYEIII